MELVQELVARSYFQCLPRCCNFLLGLCHHLLCHILQGRNSDLIGILAAEPFCDDSPASLRRESLAGFQGWLHAITRRSGLLRLQLVLRPVQARQNLQHFWWNTFFWQGFGPFPHQVFIQVGIRRVPKAMHVHDESDHHLRCFFS